MGNTSSILCLGEEIEDEKSSNRFTSGIDFLLTIIGPADSNLIVEPISELNELSYWDTFSRLDVTFEWFDIPIVRNFVFYLLNNNSLFGKARYMNLKSWVNIFFDLLLFLTKFLICDVLNLSSKDNCIKNKYISLASKSNNYKEKLIPWNSYIE